MKPNDPNQLDSMIDRALAGYASAEPLAGIEQRVLNRIAAAGRGTQTSKVIGWAFAFPILLALLPIAIAVWAPAWLVPAVTQPARIEFASLPSVGPPRNEFVASRPAWPKRQQRMGPRRVSKITSEERALLAMVESHPAEYQQLFAAMQARHDEPVEIHEIQIASLQITEVQ